MHRRGNRIRTRLNHAVISDEQFRIWIDFKPLKQRLQLWPQPIAAQSASYNKERTQSFVAALLLFLTSLFGGHHTVTVHVAPNQPHATSTTHEMPRK